MTRERRTVRCQMGNAAADFRKTPPNAAGTRIGVPSVFAAVSGWRPEAARLEPKLEPKWECSLGGRSTTTDRTRAPDTLLVSERPTRSPGTAASAAILGGMGRGSTRPGGIGAPTADRRESLACDPQADKIRHDTLPAFRRPIRISRSSEIVLPPLKSGASQELDCFSRSCPLPWRVHLC